MPKICCIIPTKDRPKDIKSVLESLAKQSSLPEKVIIIDGSDNPVQQVVESLNIPWVDYHTLRPPGLARQKNMGIKLALEGKYDWIGFLDDDLVLEEDCIQNLKNDILNNDSVRGIGLGINNQPVVNNSFLKKAILVDDGLGGHITKSGCPTQIRPATKNQFVSWIYGGATFWHRSILEGYKFDEWFSGVGYFEDVDFSYRVSRDHDLLISANARCWHYHHPVSLEKLPLLGEWHLTAWWYFSRKVGGYNKTITFLSMLSLSVLNFSKGIISFNKKSLYTTIGNVKGLLRILGGNANKIKGFHK
jgi:glycosyltransferase involved in cell wall biosynthesis